MVSSPQKYVLIWFKNELRVQDNRLLAEASKFDLPVLGFYCFDQKMESVWMDGIPRMDERRKSYLNVILKELHGDLDQINVPFKITKGSTYAELKALLEIYNVRHILCSTQIAPQEKEISKEVRSALPIEISIHEVEEGNLIDPNNLPFDSSGTPEVYTQFRKKVEKTLVEYEEEKVPVFPYNDVSFELPSYIKSAAGEFVIAPGESAGLERLEYYLWQSKKVAQYKVTRNGLMGTEFSTRFSAYLAFGSLSPRYIYSEIKRFERKVKKNASTYWVVFELLWREFFRIMMRKHGISSFNSEGYNRANHKLLEVNMDLFGAWANAKTKNTFVNSGMRELNATGWLSNRMRQNVASFLINELGVDWRLGAAYFEYRLIDYDVCSNTGNWLYQSGYGNDPRGRRVFNFNKQQQQYDPNQAYIHHWLSQNINV